MLTLHPGLKPLGPSESNTSPGTPIKMGARTMGLDDLLSSLTALHSYDFNTFLCLE